MSVDVIVTQHMHGRPYGGLASQKSRHASAVSGRVLLPCVGTGGPFQNKAVRYICAVCCVPIGCGVSSSRVLRELIETRNAFGPNKEIW